jgi:hypothetical protein
MPLQLVSLITRFRASWIGVGGRHEAASLQDGIWSVGYKDTVAEFHRMRCHAFALGLATFLRTKGLGAKFLVQRVSFQLEGGQSHGSGT